MKVSIIVPVYNAAPYLRKCIGSILGQTWQDIEVILVNDGSGDGSAEICREFQSDPRVKYFYQENSGPGEKTQKDNEANQTRDQKGASSLISAKRDRDARLCG